MRGLLKFLGELNPELIIAGLVTVLFWVLVYRAFYGLN